MNNSGSSNPYGQYCGATLVKANKLVTAAHCMNKSRSSYTAVQGRDDLTKPVGKTSKIAAVWVDPDYGVKPGHDVAVLTLSTPFTGHPGVYAEVATYYSTLTAQINS